MKFRKEDKMSNVVLMPWEDVKGFLKEGQT